MNKLLNHIIFTVLLCCCIQNADAQCSITATTNVSTLTCGVAPLRTCGGILYIGDGTTVMNLNMNADLNLTCLGAIQVIVRNNASLDFHSGNDYLTLAGTFDDRFIVFYSSANPDSESWTS